jgi:deoxyribodipyrimidine photolyase-related protein
MRNANQLGQTRSLGPAWWAGETGIPPVDDVIKKVQAHAYAHHIERLMVIGNLMLLCETEPTEVYRWFMSLHIDAYDWVMVPNVYGMSQFSDLNSMVTKPYISGSNYILNMSHYKKDEWCDIWDGLFWNFIEKDDQRLSISLSRLFLISPRAKKKACVPLSSSRRAWTQILWRKLQLRMKNLPL